MAADADISRRGGWAALVALVALAAMVRIGVGMALPADERAIDALPDQREYLTLARNLLSGRGLAFYDGRFADVVYAYRTPGYPAFLAAVGARVRAARVAQALLDASTVLAAYWLARALVRPAAARWAAWGAATLVAVNPFLIYLSALLLSETLATAMLAWGMLLLVVGGRGARLRLVGEVEAARETGEATPNRYAEVSGGFEKKRERERAGAPDRPPRRGLGTMMWLAGGAVLALSGLVRPAAFPTALLLGIGASFVNRPPGRAYHPGAARPHEPRWPLPVGATMLLLTAAAALPWALRNHAIFQAQAVPDAWVWTTTNEGITLYDGFNPDATGASDQAGIVADMPQLASMGEWGRNQYLKEKAWRFIRQHPRRALELAAAKAGRTWSPLPLSEAYGSRRNQIIAACYAAPFFLLAAAGLARGAMRRSAKVFLLIPAIYLTGVHMMSVGSLRYRLPAEPPLAVLASSVLAPRSPAWKRAAMDED